MKGTFPVKNREGKFFYPETKQIEKEAAFVADYNQKLIEKNRPAILVAKDVEEAQTKLRDWMTQLGGVKPGAFTLHGIVKSAEPLAERLKQILRDNITLVTPGLFERFVAASGLEALVAELQNQFRIRISA